MNALDVNPELQNLLQPVVLEQEAPPVEEAADPAPVAEEPPKKSFDYNAAQLRKAKEEAEQEIYRLRRELEQARQHSQRGAQSDEDEDTIITLKEARKIAVEEARRVQHQNDSRFMEDRLRAKFPDFADVVTEESVARLRYEDPELAESINQNPDMHNKLVALYKVIKRSEP